MFLSQTAEYALRAMVYLANLPEGHAARARDLSAATGVPAHYLSKILSRLVAAGLLTSQKGHGGGFSLALPAEYIRFLDILIAADFHPHPDRCAFGWGTCNPDQPCPLHPAFTQLNESFCTWAATTTLGNLRGPCARLAIEAHAAAASSANGEADLDPATDDASRPASVAARRAPAESGRGRKPARALRPGSEIDEAT